MRAILVALLLIPALALGQAQPWTKAPLVLVVGAEGEDDLRLVRDAVDFWNREFASLGSPFRLGPVVQSEASVRGGELVAMSARVLNREAPGELPDYMRGLPGDLIVAFGGGQFSPFGVRWPAHAKALVGLWSRAPFPQSRHIS